MKMTVRSSAGSIQERRAGRAAPGILARGPQDLRARRRLHDREAEAEPDAPVGRFREHAGLGELRQLLAAGQVVHRDQLHRLPAEQGTPSSLLRLRSIAVKRK
jgi:hypothetical protein